MICAKLLVMIMCHFNQTGMLLNEVFFYTMNFKFAQNNNRVHPNKIEQYRILVEYR